MPDLDEPIAYTIGDQPFLGLTIYLDSRPLIPRVETEWWAERLVKDAQVRRFENVSERGGVRHSKFSAENYACSQTGGPVCLSFLDLCAGSGAIGCAALARLPQTQVFFGEIDPRHEATIKKNIRENNLDSTRADVRIGDLFEPFADMTFDLIAANPPYVPAGRTLPTSVRGYEPPCALYSGTDGLDLTRRIAKALPAHLAKGGEAWIECDESHADTARLLFEEQGFSARILLDQYQKPRVIVVSFH